MAQPETIGRYKIVSELGHGAMGAVYRATDPMMDRTVAIKTILAGALAGPQAQEYRDRFVREARAAGRLQHPGIVTVYDVGEADGIPYLVMEFVNGRTLASAMESGERFSFDRVYEMGFQVADALGYAHRHGVIHRDIKPANILLALEGEGMERAKIADLGVAKLAASQITTTGQLLGTPAFMPPEQFTGAPLDGRADIFSLGVILYWLATGDKPFGGDTITAVSYKVVHSMPAPPRRINPAVPAQLERIILRCLEKDPEQRYAKAEQLAADLAAARAGREISATAAISAVGAASATQTAMAPVTMIDGDPNTTLDSSVRLEMMKRAPMQASGISSPTETMQTPAPAPAQVGQSRPASKLADRKVWALGLIFVILVLVFMRHRRSPAQDAGSALAQQVKNTVEQQVAQQAQSAAQQIPTTPADPNNPGASGQSPNGGAPGSGSDPAASGTANASDASHASGATPAGAGASLPGANNPDAKPASNPPANSTASKPAGRRGGLQTATKPNGSAATQQGKQQTSTQTPIPPALPLPSAGGGSTGSGAAAASQILEKPPAPSPSPAANGTASAPPSAAVAAPSGADAETAGRLHIDDGRVPNSVSFLVLLDGKRLMQRGILAEGQNSPSREDLLITPGQHELKVIALSGGVAIGESNTVKQDFKSKKKKALRIELRDNSSGQMLKKTSSVAQNSSVFVIELRDSGGFLGVH